MANELTTKLETQPNMAITFTNDQVKLIKEQIAPQATNDELKLFLYQAQRTGLDPLKRQIYCIKIGGKMSIQTSIDGFRVIAERSGSYAGQSEPIFEEANGKIIKCKISVFRFSSNGQRYEASVGVAYMSEYEQPSPMWKKMPHTMIAKCAEALALRKAYPQDLSGLYTQDEMAQAEPNANQEFNAKTESLPSKQKSAEPQPTDQDVIDANVITTLSEEIKKNTFKTGTELLVNKADFIDKAKLMNASEACIAEVEKRIVKFAEYMTKQNTAK